MYLIVKEQVAWSSVEEQVALVVRIEDYSIPSGITTDLLTEEGQLIVCLSPGVATVIDPPTANGQTLVSDLTVAGLWKIGAASAGGGGLITLTNKDDETAVVGSVVIADLANDEAFISTAVPSHLGVIGVTAEEIGINAEGNVCIAGLNDVLVTGNVARGEWLVSSATAWRAKTAGYDKPAGAIGYAMTEYTGGATGSVSAVVTPAPRHLTTAGTSWILGGQQAAGQTTAQKFTVAAGTWATIAGAALPTATFAAQGLGYGTTAGYSIGGNQGAGAIVTAYKMPFSTEVTAAASSANLPTAKYGFRGSYAGAAHGYNVGGFTAAAAATCAKLTYATDTMSAHLAGTLSAARFYVAGITDGTVAFAQGGISSGVSDKITFASDAVSDNDAGDITASATAYISVSFPGTAGYMADKSGANNYSHKVTFSSGASAVVTSTLPADQSHGAGICDGSGLAWFSGDDASPYSVSHKFTKATETYAADAGAVLSAGAHFAANFNNGAY